MFQPFLVQPHNLFLVISTIPYPHNTTCLRVRLYLSLSLFIRASLLPLIFLKSFSSQQLPIRKTMLLTALLLSLVFLASLANIFLASLANILFHVPLKKLTVLLKPLFARRLTPQPASGCNEVDGAAATTREQQRLQNRKERPIMSAERRAEVESVFATFDRNRDGLITREELRQSLRGLGISVSDAEVEEAMIGSDANGDGCINLDEFCGLLESISMASGDEREARKVGGDYCEGDAGEAELKEAFDVFDRDRDGVITVEELGLVLSLLGMSEGKRAEECEEMIRKVDVDGDGMVNFDEFKRMMRGVQTILVSAY